MQNYEPPNAENGRETKKRLHKQVPQKEKKQNETQTRTDERRETKTNHTNKGIKNVAEQKYKNNTIAGTSDECATIMAGYNKRSVLSR